VRLSKVAMKRLVLLVLAIACLVPAMPAAAAEPDRPSRAQALAALKRNDADERLRGALGLAIVGRMEDAPTLIIALRDADERVRAVAEQSLWAVWSRSGDARVDELFGRGVAQMGEQRLPEAIATLPASSSSNPTLPKAGTSAPRRISSPANSGARSRTATRSSSATRSTSACFPATARSTSNSTNRRERWSISAARSRSIPTSKAYSASRKGWIP
jgi:hypothetical protein